MQVIAKPRNSGKTTELISLSAELQLPIVCFSEHEAFRLNEKAARLGIKIPKPLSVHQVTQQKGTRHNILVDNLDIILERFFPEINIHVITLTGGIV